MADPHASNNLGYGSLGTPIYDSNLREWTFLRKIGHSASDDQDEDFQPTTRGFQIQPFGDGPTLVVPPVTLSSHYFPLSSPPVENLRSLRKTLPQLAPVPSHLEYRRYVAEEPNVPFYRNRDLLAFGNAFQLPDDDLAQESIFTPIIAHTYGEAGEVLRIARLIKKSSTVCPNEEDLRSVRLPSIDTKGAASWKGLGGPIQQIRSADSEDNAGTWIAVRFTAATTFCAPCVHSRPMLDGAESDGDSQIGSRPSVLDANPFVSLPISRTGGAPHADVDFHPEDHFQVAIVDVCGTWSIWQLQDPYLTPEKSSERIQLLASGKLGFEESPQRILDVTPWHSVCWLAKDQNGFNKLLVCSRRKTALFDINGRVLPMAYIDLGTPKDQQSILDIIWLASGVPLWLVQDKPLKDLEVVLSVRHFLNTEDTSVYLSTLEIADGTLALISSLFTPLTLAFQFGHLQNVSAPLCIADPTLILLRSPVKSSNDPQREHRQPARIYLYSIENDYQNGQCPSQDRRLLKILVVYPDQAVYEHALQFSTENPVVNKTVDFMDEDLSSSCGQSVDMANADPEDLEDFVIKDNEDSAFQNAAPFDDLTCLMNDRKAIQHIRTTWHIDHKDIYQITAGHEAPTPSLKNVMDATIPFADFLENIKAQLLSPSQAPEYRVRLISELTESTLIISDIEEESQKLRNSLTQIQNDEAHSTSLGGISAQISHSFPSLAETYDELARSFLTPLPPETPSQLHVSKEHACRRVAAQLMLSNYVLRAKHGAPQTSQQSNGPAPEQLTLSLPSPASTQQREGSPNVRSAAESAAQRLRAFSPVKTSFSAADENVISEVLGHLPASPSASPQKYSYHASNKEVDTSRTISQAGSIDPKARQKAEKALQKLKRKKEKLDSQLVENQRNAPPIVKSSQPNEQVIIPTHKDDRDIKSSQAVANSTLREQDEGKTTILPVRGGPPVATAFRSRNNLSRTSGPGKRKSGF